MQITIFVFETEPVSTDVLNMPPLECVAVKMRRMSKDVEGTTIVIASKMTTITIVAATATIAAATTADAGVLNTKCGGIQKRARMHEWVRIGGGR